jgi:dihydroxyacetone kinase-like predicted kinase
VTIASRQALTTAGPCAVGDALGVVDGDIAIVGATIGAVAHGVLDAMLAVGGELVTLVLGVEADEEFGRGLADWLATSHPTVEVITVRGGQPRWPVIIGVE